MRSVYLIAYDVGDDKRLRKVYQKMRGFGDSLQYSVFYCELSAMELQKLKDEMWELLNLDDDRLMLVNLGPTGGRGSDCIEIWGKPRELPTGGSAIIL